MKKNIIALIVLAFVFQLSLQAAYLTKVPQSLKQPDGTILNCFATGDEFHNWLHDANNFTIIQDPSSGYYVYAIKVGTKLMPSSYVAGTVNPAAIGLEPGVNLEPSEISRMTETRYKVPPLKGSSGYATTGTINNIVVFIRFDDQPEFTSNISTYDNAFNSTTSSSMLEYFKETSGTQLDITTSFFPAPSGSVVVSYKDSHPRDYYRVYSATNTIGYSTAEGEAERTSREMTLLKDATLAVKSEIEATGLDFDNDNNGQIDNVCFIIQGAVEAWADLLWPHMWALYTYNVQVAGARVYNFNFQLSNSFGVSVLCHEMSHSLGFPDLYRYTDKTINPVGQWDVMASNTNPPQYSSAYTKMKYGHWFSSIPVISTPGTYSLAPLSTDPFASYKILSPNSSSEFFVLEYRQASGRFEQALPGSGLIIYRVNTNAGGNSGGPPDEVYVYRPDGTTTVNGTINQAYFSSGAGRTSFTATSNPSCFLSNGGPGGIEITNIGAAGETISFTFNYSSTGPRLAVTPASRNIVAAGGATSFAVSNPDGGTLTWTASVTSGPAWIHITSGNSGTNAGTINVTVDANTGSQRSGTITVNAGSAADSPKQLTITQDANPPVLSVLPASRSIDFGATSLTYDVTNTGGGTMAWTAAISGTPSWCRITSGSSGSNTGVITVEVDENPDNATRNGTITITSSGATGSPKTVTFSQAAHLPVLLVTPDKQTVDFAAGTTTFAVSNTGGGTLNYTTAITAGNSWITISSGGTGSNSGTITLAIAANSTSSVRIGEISITSAGATGSPKTVTIEQAGATMLLEVGPEIQNVPFAAGTTTFAVSNTGGGSMSWTAAVTTGSSWLHITSGASGTNAGTINVSTDKNPDNTERTGIITITAAGATGSPKTVSVVQAANPPVLDVLPATRSFDYTTNSTTFEVTNTGGGNMSWTAAVTAGSSWVHVTSGSSGNNTGTISVSLDANPDNAERTGILTVTSAGVTGSPKTVTVIQAGNPSVINVSPDSYSTTFPSGTTTFVVTNTGGGTMNWTAEVTTGSSWAHISSGSSGSNTGTISVSYDLNPDNAERTAVFTVASTGATGSPKTVTITQGANSMVLNVGPESQTVAPAGQPTSFSVSNNGGGTLNWTAEVTTGSAWAHITSGASGSNSGTINVSADANPGVSERTAVITVTAAGAEGSPKTVTVVQGGTEMTLNVGPLTQTISYAGGPSSFAVSNTGGGTMNWTAAVTSGSTFVHITSGSSGYNSGTISVTVDANPENSARSAIITVTAADATGSPKTVTIIQTANPAILTVLPASREIGFSSASVSFEVTNTGGGSMPWTAAVTAGNSWVHINSGSAGTNTGTISVTVDTNPDNAERTGEITVTAADATGSPVNVYLVQAPQEPVLTIQPLSRQVDYPSNSVEFDVSNTGGGNMNWTAQLAEDITWARILNGQHGLDNGKILVEIDENLSGDIRTVSMSVFITGIPGSTQMVNISQNANTSGINDLLVENSFTVYPNPSDGKVTLQIKNYKGISQRLEVINIVGQTEIEQPIYRESTTIDLSCLTKGIYFFRITSEFSKPGIIRVVKN